MIEKKDEPEFLPDTTYEGRSKAYFDIDRMINEGMAGGSVHMREDTTNINEAMELTQEAAPHEETP